MHKGLAGGLQIPSFGWQAGGAVGSVTPPPCRSRAAAAVEQRWVCSVWETGCDLAGQDLQVWGGVWQGCALRTPHQLSSALTSPVVEV